MKNVFKYLVIVIVLFCGIVFLGYSLYSKSVLKNLQEKDYELKIKWNQFISKKNERNQLLIKYCNTSEVQNEIKDSLLYYVKFQFKDEMIIYKTINLKSFIINEYNINRILMRCIDLTDFKKEELIELNNNINSLNHSSNILISEYNNRVMDFNQYRSVFPNFFISRKYKFKNIKYYELKYGVENDDPRKKSDIEKWIETGDPIYLEKGKK